MSTSDITGSPSKSENRRRVQRLRTVRNHSEVKNIQNSLKDIHSILSLYPIDPDPDFFENKDSMKQAVDKAIDYGLSQDKRILKKIDYYITPYNKEHNFKDSMDFGEKHKLCKTMNDKAQKDWKMISNFIFNTDKKEFRNKLNQYNPSLYGSIKELAYKLVKKKTIRSPRMRQKSTKLRKLATKEFKINVVKVEQDSELKIPLDEAKKQEMSVISPLMKIKRSKENRKKEKEIKRIQKDKDRMDFSSNIEQISNRSTKPVRQQNKITENSSNCSQLSGYNSLKPGDQIHRLIVPKMSEFSLNRDLTVELPSIKSEKRKMRRDYQSYDSSVASSKTSSNKIIEVRSVSRTTQMKIYQNPVLGNKKSIDITNSIRMTEEAYDDTETRYGHSVNARQSYADTKLPLIHRRNLTVKRPRKTNSTEMVNQYMNQTTKGYLKKRRNTRELEELQESNLKSVSSSVSSDNNENVLRKSSVFKENSVNVTSMILKNAPSKLNQEPAQKITIPKVRVQKSGSFHSKSSKSKNSKNHKKTKTFASPDKENYKRIDPTWIIYNPKNTTRKQLESLKKARKAVSPSLTSSTCRTYGIKDARMCL